MSLALNKLNYSPKRLRIRTHPPQASLRVSPHECLGHCACFVKKIKENLNGCYRPCRSIKPTGPVTAWPHHRGAASEFDHTSPQDRADQACAGEHGLARAGTNWANKRDQLPIHCFNAAQQLPPPDFPLRAPPSICSEAQTWSWLQRLLCLGQAKHQAWGPL